MQPGLMDEFAQLIRSESVSELLKPTLLDRQGGFFVSASLPEGDKIIWSARSR